ncbi:unnamed protein product [Paramecium sonneborni]|uniref:Uncharacterized protein n=1 Tax=Paramecium sonneborni TaxID=65129 RepID=A0A8S1L1U4_9CILI|nr:unnamed protein product [Paramecium sonneborni]
MFKIISVILQKIIVKIILEFFLIVQIIKIMQSDQADH